MSDRRASDATPPQQRVRELMDEWEAVAEMGWQRELSIEEAQIVLRALREGWDSRTTAEWQRERPSRG